MSIVGKTIEYSTKNEAPKKAIVLDQILMLDIRKEKSAGQSKEVHVSYVVTGYLIKEEGSGKIDSIVYWRVKAIT